MAELLRMPEVSANLESAILSNWMVAEGDPFEIKDVIAVIETEKAVVDYEIEIAGVLMRRLVTEGDEVLVGDPIAVIGRIGETITDIDVVVSRLLGESEVPVEPASASSAMDTPIVPPVSTDAVHAGTAGVRRFSSPLARKFAREAGLDISGLVGSGPGGRIVRRDVVAAISQSDSAQTSSAPISAQAPSANSLPVDYIDTPHSRLRKVIASRLTESKATAPHFYVRGSAEVSSLLRLRQEINEGGDTRVSVNDFLIKAMGKAHLIVPGLNVIWTPEAIRSFSSVDISVAISTEGGLVTPVIRGVEKLSLTEVSRIVKDYAERGRTGRLQQSELEGGTATISNLGMFGTEEFAAIINPPQASILAVGATREEAIVRDGQLAVGTVLRFTLSVDHRPVDGVLAAEWMSAFSDLLHHPARILA